MLRKIYSPLLTKYNDYKTFKAFKMEKDALKKILIDEDFTSFVNVNPKHIKKIAFIIPGMSKYSGGHTSILRLGSELMKKGYLIDYISFVNQEISLMEENASFNLKSYQGEFLLYDDNLKGKYDVVIATNWESAYYAKKFNGYKVYFVQDYEPYFYRYGETYILAKKTYEFGFHIVSLGKWNLKMINQECANNIHANYITFPYESNEYHFCPRSVGQYANLKNIRIAIYIKDDGKRLPFLIQAMIENVSLLFKKDGITIEPIYFGIYDKYIPDFGVNYGRLSKKQLEKLYHECDFGLVASLTNISLIPYEMIGSGLPLIEFKEGTFLDFFDEDNAIITSFNYKDLYMELKKCLENPDSIIEMINKSHSCIENLGWDKTADEFDKILKECINE